jgi:outer membrane protein OmpA-like peptidoglycan-associated protein
MKNVNQSYQLLIILALFISLQAFSQNGQYRFFTATAGVNFVENNDGKQLPTFKDMDFNTPLMLGLEGRLSEAFSWTVHLTTNELEDPNGRKQPYFGVDTMFNWYIDSLIWDNNDIEWSFGGGAGYFSLKGERARPTVNIGSNFRWWFLDWMGVSLQGLGKIALSEASRVENYYQYNLGLVWGIKSKPKSQPVEDDTSSELEEMAQQEAPTAQQPTAPAQPVVPVNSDSGEVSGDSGPKPILVESVFFDRNSSYLESAETRKLDNLINLLKNDTALIVEIETYTDASGQVAYNNWIAEQRLKRTSDYLTERGVPASRIKGQPIGVDPESQECQDCTVEDQRIFRRAEFRVYRK